jgi:hypothetical protein
MSRPAELSPSAGARRRCTAGHHGHSCKKRTCEICGLTWAKDWRVVLFANLKHLDCLVMLSAVTPPGQDRLPYDEAHCAHLGPHSHGKRHGCRIDPNALAQWSHDVSRRWKRLHNAARNGVKRRHGRCLPLVMRAWEPQARGAAHVHPVFAVPTPADVVLATAYFEEVARLAPRHGFGFVGRKRGVSQQIMEAGRAAAYLSSYFVSGRGEKATLSENARNAHLPRMLLWLTPKLTRQTGVTMRSRRRCRQLWAIRSGLLPAPGWSGVELARTILLAGAWPAAARAP